MSQIKLHRDAVTKRWCIMTRTSEILETFDTREQAIKALQVRKGA
jgi:hypothetical protein